MLLFEQLFGDL